MSWFRLDDQFPAHPKVMRAGPEAAWLYVCGGCYCAEYLTDGIIPAEVVPNLSTLRGHRRLAGTLVDIGLWRVTVDGDYEMHDYLDYNPTREKVLGDRERSRERRANAGEKSGVVRANEMNPVPQGNKKRSQPTEEFSTTERHAQFCVEHGLALEQERAHWLEWCEAHGKTFVSQNAGFATWLRQAVAFGRGGRPVVTLEELAQPVRSFPAPWVCSVGNPECCDGWIDVGERHAKPCACQVKASAG